MPNPPAPAGVSPRSNFAVPDFAGMACRLAFMLEEEIAALEIAEREPGYSDNRVKALIALTKTLQAMEDMVQKQEEKNADDSGTGDYRDIVEYREAIARKLEALAAAEDGRGGAAGRDPDAGGTDED